MPNQELSGIIALEVADPRIAPGVPARVGDLGFTNESPFVYYKFVGPNFTDWVLFESGGSSSGVSSVNGESGIVVLDKSDIGLANVPNLDTSNADNHSDGVTNKVFTAVDEAQITQNALDISILLAQPTVEQTFSYYAEHYSATPTQETYSGSGTVLSYVLNAVTRYRFIPEPYDPSQDAFYSSFSNPTLSGLIVRKSLT